MSKLLQFSILLAMCLLSPLSILANSDDDKYLSYKDELSELRVKKNTIHNRVATAKKKEKLALAKLQRTQQELNKYQNTYKSSQREINKLNEQLEDSKEQIVELESEASVKIQDLRVSLHALYIKKSNIISSFVASLINSQSITDFLNTLYYQRRMIASKMALINEVKEKQLALNNLNQQMNSQKEHYKHSKEEAYRVRQAISNKKEEEYKLVNKLRKERLSYEVAERQLEQQSNKITDKILRLTEGGNIDLSDLVNLHYVYPVKAPITSSYGHRRHPIFRVKSFHSGIDLGARYKTPIKASNGGIVIFAGWSSGYGKTVIVSHGHKKSTLYAHMQSTKVHKGDKVSQGKVLGYVGSTGYSTGPHLHFEYRVNGKHQNPRNIL